jgi:hypothetical protein
MLDCKHGEDEQPSDWWQYMNQPIERAPRQRPPLTLITPAPRHGPPNPPAHQREPVALLRAMRPTQWLKNGLVFLALVFSVGHAWQLQEPSTWLPLLAQAILAFAGFSAAASAAYLINDLCDIERDRLHPRKRRRPLASGALRPRTARAAALLLAGAAGCLARRWVQAFWQRWARIWCSRWATASRSSRW